MNANATIKVEFLPGDDIRSAFEEAVRLAQLLGVFVVFDFNGVKCRAKPSSDIEKGVALYHEAQTGDSVYC